MVISFSEVFLMKFKNISRKIIHIIFITYLSGIVVCQEDIGHSGKMLYLFIPLKKRVEE